MQMIFNRYLVLIRLRIGQYVQIPTLSCWSVC